MGLRHQFRDWKNQRALKYKCADPHYVAMLEAEVETLRKKVGDEEEEEEDEHDVGTTKSREQPIAPSTSRSPTKTVYRSKSFVRPQNHPSQSLRHKQSVPVIGNPKLHHHFHQDKNSSKENISKLSNFANATKPLIPEPTATSTVRSSHKGVYAPATLKSGIVRAPLEWNFDFSETRNIRDESGGQLMPLHSATRRAAVVAFVDEEVVIRDPVERLLPEVW